MHSLSVPVWLIIGQETGYAKHAKKGRKMYHRGRCRIYAPLQLSNFPKHQWSPSRSASCRSPAVLLASRCQQKMDWNCHRIDTANDWRIYLSMSAFKENLVHQTRWALGVCTYIGDCGKFAASRFRDNGCRHMNLSCTAATSAASQWGHFIRGQPNHTWLVWFAGHIIFLLFILNCCLASKRRRWACMCMNLAVCSKCELPSQIEWLTSTEMPMVRFAYSKQLSHKTVSAVSFGTVLEAQEGLCWSGLDCKPCSSSQKMHN